MAPLWHINYKTHHLFIQTVYYIYLQIGIKAFSTFYYFLYFILCDWETSTQCCNLFKSFSWCFLYWIFFVLSFSIVFSRENVEMCRRKVEARNIEWVHEWKKFINAMTFLRFVNFICYFLIRKYEVKCWRSWELNWRYFRY